jgi:glutamate synthase domain-containing protein 3/glutamate synthase domain-containing protein 1
MSLGSIGWKLTLARYLAGMALRRFTGTGEGGYPLERHERLARFFPRLSNEQVRWLGRQLENWVATQTATGYFGVTEDTIRRAKKIVLKFAQGAKPGLGGHILGAKVTTQVEDLRGVIAGISVFSPFPFHDVYSIEDVTKMIEWLRTINPDAIITVKISTPLDVYHVALGLVTGGADEIQIDATAGGTGAAPDIARNRIAMPLEYALADVHKFLVEQGERSKVVLVASGGIRSAYDMAKAIILGADKVILGTQEIVAEQCNRCGNCEAPGGCQKGITTTVEQLEEQKDILLNAQWLVNAQVAVVQHLIQMMYVWGIKDIRELRGRTDLIAEWGWQEIRSQTSRSKHQYEGAKKKAKIFVNEWDNSKEERRELDACGVVSFACTQSVPVESIQTACQQMHNRGNGRGGGILGLGGMFSPQFEDCYAFQIITLVPASKRRQKILDITKDYLKDFDILDRSGNVLDAQTLSVSNIESFRNPRRQKHGRDVTYEEAGLAVDPGDLYRFFVRVKKEALLHFAREVLETCKISESERRILENGNPTQFLQKHNIAGKWLDYFVKYYGLLTEEYLNSIDPKSKFWQEQKYESLWRDLEDEFVYRRAFEINQHYYIEPQNRSENPEAFVSSMMKDGGIWKLVGYAEQAADYWIVGDAQYVSTADLDKIIAEAFQEENQDKKCKLQVTWKQEEGQVKINVSSKQGKKISLIVPKRGRRAVVIHKYGAHVWIGHQRFPTVFSPYSGGSHPFYGRVYEALIHNGDFANYVAMVRFWDQFGGAPQFRTDTEMAAKAYAILKQMGYPQAHLFEAIAPTTGIDLKRLKKTHPELAEDFETIQKSQIAGSPDGPWFFIIGDQDPVTRDLKVVGLTDTSVLRPSVFVWQESSNGRWASIGLIGSEEQACRSVLNALYNTGVLATKEPDCVRIIRGGSVEQEKVGEIQGGGAIVFHLKREAPGKYDFKITDKYGTSLNSKTGRHYDFKSQLRFDTEEVQTVAKQVFDSQGNIRINLAEKLFQFVKDNLKDWEYNTFRWLVETLGNYAETDELRCIAIEALTLIKDRIQGIDVGEGLKGKKRSSLNQIISDELDSVFDHIEKLGSGASDRKYYRVTSVERNDIPQCADGERVLVVDATGFPPEGHQSLARTLVQAYDKGWRSFIVYRITGQRYLGSGFGPNTDDLEIHLYGSSGQDIANSMMGGTVHVHADAQNDMAKIIHSGTVVVHGLAGNTGVYGAKGGDIFVRDSVGTRWVINSVSSPAGPGLRVVIVGTAMEYLAESLMGGMVLVLGLEWDAKGVLRRKYLPFAGNSILAGASAGKVIVYDPDDRLEKEQYTGAVDMGFLSRDWAAVYKNFASLVAQSFSKDEWGHCLERWRTLAKYTLKSKAWQEAKKQDALEELVQVLKQILESEHEAVKWVEDAQIVKTIIDECLTGKEWRTLVRQLGQILAEKPWNEGLELLERLRDWKEFTELLEKADKFFQLGLVVENDWLYLPIDGKKTEIKREDFKVLRPLKPEERKELEKKKLEEVAIEEATMVEEY